MLGAGSFLFLPRSGRVLRAKWALVAVPAPASLRESSALARDYDQEIGAQAKDLAWGWTGSSLARQSLALPSY